jgi:amidase
MGPFEEYDQYDGLGLAELVNNGEVSPTELVEEAIARIEALNPQLNAVIHKMYDQATETARNPVKGGPFQGVPFLLKDLTAAYAGEPLRAGCRFLADFIPDHDSELVRRYKRAGVIVMGKTNTPEFGLVPYTEPESSGPTHNPWDLTRNPGGSSGGSAAAVAAGMVPLAHGNDGGGSIRIPASCCGLVGLKPTRGRVPIGPDIAEAWHGFSIDHVLSRSVRDSAAMLDATHGADVGAPYVAPAPERPYLDEVGADLGKLRIAFTAKPFMPSTIHQDCLEGLEACVELCENLGHEVVEVRPQINAQAFAKAFFMVVCVETRAAIEEYEQLLARKASSQDFEPSTWAVGLLGKEIPGSELSKALHMLKGNGREVGRFFEDYDVLLTPTLARPPVRIGELQPRGVEAAALKLLCNLNSGKVIDTFVDIEELAGQIFDFIPFTPLFNASGSPAMSLPLYWNKAGLPIGMQFATRFGDEATLFRLAAQLEEAQPWFDRRPGLVKLASHSY